VTIPPAGPRSESGGLPPSPELDESIDRAELLTCPIQVSMPLAALADSDWSGPPELLCARRGSTRVRWAVGTTRVTA
jgi:hypothetical protein